jgi:hypothetical protein
MTIYPQNAAVVQRQRKSALEPDRSVAKAISAAIAIRP